LIVSRDRVINGGTLEQENNKAIDRAKAEQQLAIDELIGGETD
jgi:hypothetical protein